MMARANERLVALKHEEAPRSWSKEAKLAFLHLPPELQVYYAAREKNREREVRRAQNDRAKALQKLVLAEAEIAKLEAKLDGAAIQKPAEVTDGNPQIAAA